MCISDSLVVFFLSIRMFKNDMAVNSIDLISSVKMLWIEVTLFCYLLLVCYFLASYV